MQLLEADFAQIEHINQIIHNNLNHLSWSCFDTHYLIEEHNKLLERLYTSQEAIDENKIGVYNSTNPSKSKITKNVVDVRYNSSIVSITKIKNGYQYDFEIRNALWDGGYKITKSKNKSTDEDEVIEDVIVSRDDKNKNKVSFKIFGDSSASVRICFRMNMKGNGRNIETNSLNIDNPKEYTHQYDKTVCEVGYVKTETGRPAEGITVSITPVNSQGTPIVDGIQSATAVTDANGKFKMCYSSVKTPGDYYVLMSIGDGLSDTVHATQIIHIKKVQNQSVSIDWGDESQYKNVYKGSIKTYEIKINIKNEFGIHDEELDKKLSGKIVNVTWIGIGDVRHPQTCTITTNKNGEYVINPRCSYRRYYQNSSRLEVSVPVFDGYGAVTVEHMVRHVWFTANTYTELEQQVTNMDGADWIFLKPQTYTRTKTIVIKRPMTIAGTKGKTHCQIDGNKNNIFKIQNDQAETDNYLEVNLIGLKLYNAECAINNATGCRLLVDRCYFTENSHTNQHQRGCSIFMPVTDETKAHNNLWKAEIRNSYFYNNRGNEIQSIGKTYIHHSLFKTDAKEYLQQPEVKVVSVRAGSVKYTHNKSHILIPFRNKSDSMPSNHCYAKALTYVDTNCTFNGKGPSQLKKDNSLPLYGDPYYNEAYTRACYFYPHEIQDYIICSPRAGHERKATGHASSAKNWVFYDGYYFTRLRWSMGNSKNPWTQAELTIPDNLGIYDASKNKFIEEYDPQFKNNSALTSEV